MPNAGIVSNPFTNAQTLINASLERDTVDWIAELHDESTTPALVRMGTAACTFDLGININNDSQVARWVNNNLESAADKIGRMFAVNAINYLNALAADLGTALDSGVAPTFGVTSTEFNCTTSGQTNLVFVGAICCVVGYPDLLHIWGGGDSDNSFTREKILTVSNWSSSGFLRQKMSRLLF